MYAGSSEQSIELSQKVFTLQMAAINIDLVINTTTLESQWDPFLGTQVYDIRENGTIVVVGNIVTDTRSGNATELPVPIAAPIAGGTGK